MTKKRCLFITMIEYDLYGFLNNIYYEVPGVPGTYQLSKPPY